MANRRGSVTRDPEGPTLTGLVFDIARWSGHDGPGIRSVVFLKGCPLRCVWCHNPESQSHRPQVLFLANKCILCGRCIAACPVGARQRIDGAMATDQERCENCGRCAEACFTEALQISGRRLSVDEVLSEIAEDRVFYRHSGGGVTLSGGEPAAQPAFAEAIARGCRELGIHVALETCGCVPWASLHRLVPYVDLFLYDLKVMDPVRHRQYTARSNKLVLRNLQRLVEAGKSIQVRVPLIPGHTDDEANLGAICDCTSRLGLERIAFLPFNPTTGAKYTWLGRTCGVPSGIPQDRDALQRIEKLGESFGLLVQMGG